MAFICIALTRNILLLKNTHINILTEIPLHLMHFMQLYTLLERSELLCNRIHVFTFTKQAALHKCGSHLSEMRNHSCYE